MKTLQSQINGCLARGYAHKANSKKSLDPELIEAMTKEIMKLLNTELPSTVILEYENFQNGDKKISDLVEQLLKPKRR